MSAHRKIDRVCGFIVAATLIIAFVFCNGQAFGIQTHARAIGYENRLFDHSKVHTIDIVMNDWDGFIETCESETYSSCNIVIDGEAIKNIGIRGKGNTSLSSVRNMNSDRYSFKIEFDQYDDAKTYHGLDKLCLNNVIQDNTYMKDYIAYTLMNDFGVDAPLCSYVYVTVNGEDWGLYLAVESVEDSFLKRNYGSDFGELYKPDRSAFGGGRGNGMDFDVSEFINREGNIEEENPMEVEGFDPARFFGEGGMGGFGGGMGSDDVKLKYIDDNIESYPNIFNNAKTKVSTADKNRLIRSLKALSEQTDLESTVNVEEVIRYFIVHNFLCNGDSYTGQMVHNYYLYEKDGQLSMIPWDYNLAFGSFQRTDATSIVNSPIDTPVTGDMSDRPMIAWIFDQEEYTERYHQLFKEFINSVDFVALIEKTAELIGEYVEKDPTKFCTFEEFQKGVEALAQFGNLRSESVQGQLDDVIPGTTKGQRKDSSALIDASDLELSALGSMNMGRGGNFGGFAGQEIWDETDPAEMPGRRGQGEHQMPMPENGQGEHQMPMQNRRGQGEFAGPAWQNTDNTRRNSNMSQYTLLGVSALVLLLGIIFAWKYKE